MQHNEQIKFIREKCIEANPDIKKLEFGCEISRPYYMYLQGGIIIGQDNGSYYVMYDSIAQEIAMVHDIEESEIIGRDIRLADVLLAIKKNNKEFPDTYGISILLIDYDLSKDRLEDQSPETIEFIYNLLK